MTPETGGALARLRQGLSGLGGSEYWSRLEELAGSLPFLVLLRRDFPSQEARFSGAVERRDFLRLMGASLALAGLGSCTRQPDERIYPYGKSPEATVPGRPRYFATAMPLGGAALGLLVESHEGRPTKVEGNPDHPSSLGATDAFAQAATLGLYDPDRSRTVLKAGRISTWDEFLRELEGRLDGIRARAGAGLRVLAADVGSPTLAEVLGELGRRLPAARWQRWEPVHRDQARRGAELFFGRDVGVRHRFEQAQVILALDADGLGTGAAGVRYARDLAAARRARQGRESLARIFAVESSVGLLGALADHRLTLKPSELEPFVRALARELGITVDAPPAPPGTAGFLETLNEELRAHLPGGLVIAGRTAPPVVHALTHAINHALGHVGRTVEYSEPVEPAPLDVTASLRELVEDVRDGQVETLILLGGNPVYDAPADLEFADALKTVPFRVHLALYEDETSELCHWHVPQAHFLETWSDARAHDGTATILQPLIAPLYGGKSELELLATLLGEAGATSHDLVRRRWRAAWGLAEDAPELERRWQTALHDGVVAGSALPALAPAPLLPLDYGPAPLPQTGLELAFRPDASTYDGRFANNGWLQETPRPLTLLTWDNAALVSPATAAELGIESGDVLEITAGERTQRAPAWVTPGHPDGTLTLHLGYGRRRGGRLGTGVGFDAYRLRTTYSPWAAAATVRRTGARHAFASVQDHSRMEGRDPVRVTTFERFSRGEPPAEPGSGRHAGASLYPAHVYEGQAWGMVIDLNACIGCNACMVACQAENNVPVVGKEEVARGREMHWLRVDRYYDGDGAEPRVLHQPVPCMHCENAPCEVVCPVGATVHGSEGLNEMVYNRCVGTRYCANNCPYKVRRFNFFHYSDYETEALKLGNNPDVTVRGRGVMEKCTYCVQRINEARITAKKEERGLREGEVRTACQAACPTQAIAFGDLNDPASEVAQLRREPHHYELLGELGTRPRTTYLAKLTNPSSGLAGG